MRLDYHDKKGGWEASERKPISKPVSKNKQKRGPGGVGFGIVSRFLLLVVVFAGGVATGWNLYPRTHKTPVVAARAVKIEAPTPPLPDKTPPDEAALSFYKSLPAGGNAVMGSGLNLKKQAPAAPPRPASAPSAGPAAGQTPSAEKKDGETGGSFVVQLASYRERQEADKAQGRLTGKGVAAYVTETKLSDQTVWYRVRVGRNLSRAEAEDLVGKSGKGAVVVKK